MFLTTWAAAVLLPLCSPAASERIVRPGGDVDIIETNAEAQFTTYRRELCKPGITNREVQWSVRFDQQPVPTTSATSIR